VCDFCEEAPATKHCGDCAKIASFCDECCLLKHQKGAGASHKPSVPINEHLAEVAATPALEAIAQASGSARVPVCQTHGEPITLHCTSCDAAICMECGSFDHGSHEKRKISKVVEPQLHVTTFKAMTAAGSIAALLGEAEANTQRLRQQVRSSADTAEADASRLLRTLRQAVAELGAATTAKIAATASQKEGFLARHAVDLHDAAEHATAAVGFASATMQVCNPVEKLVLKPLLIAGLERVVNHGIPLTPPCTPQLKVKATVALEQAVALIAKAIAVMGGGDR
jgi:hypothetical protein